MIRKSFTKDKEILAKNKDLVLFVEIVDMIV